jgi:hypothetical protein
MKLLSFYGTRSCFSKVQVVNDVMLHQLYELLGVLCDDMTTTPRGTEYEVVECRTDH